jgi:hypothetical protein
MPADTRIGHHVAQEIVVDRRAVESLLTTEDCIRP